MPAEKADVPGLAEAFGVSPTWTGRNVQNDILAVVDDAQAVLPLAPDLAALARIEGRRECRALSPSL